MNYRITITRTEPNLDFTKEVEAYDKAMRPSQYGRSIAIGEPPQKATVTNALIVELTEEQFKAVKAAVFKEFE
jgi:hypothetical protein